MRIKGGLLAGVAPIGLGLTLGSVDPSICSIEGEGDDTGGGGGGGGAADLLEEDPAKAAATGGDDEPPAVPDWAKGFSADKVGEELSHQEYLAKKGFADPDALVASYRAAEKSIRESGKVKVPGEGATADELAAFREAIGAPKEAAGYEVVMPEAAKEFEIDTAVLDPLKEIAFKHGIPAAAFKELSETFLGNAVEDAKAEVIRTDTDAAAKVKEWGPLAAQRKEEFRRGAELLGLNKADVANIQREFGAGRTLDMFAKIGQLAGEDFFANGDPATKFGVANLEQAQKALDALVADAAFAAKLNAKEKGAVAKYNSAIEAVAAFKAIESRKR